MSQLLLLSLKVNCLSTISALAHVPLARVANSVPVVTHTFASAEEAVH